METTQSQESQHTKNTIQDGIGDVEVSSTPPVIPPTSSSLVLGARSSSLAPSTFGTIFEIATFVRGST